MKKLFSAAFAVILAVPALSLPAAADTPKLPFTLEAPRNVSMTWLEGNDSDNTIEIHYSQNNSMSEWSTRMGDAHDEVVSELNGMGYDDLWINAQIDWSIDTTDDWHCNQYWETGGYDADYHQHLGDWAWIDCGYSSEIAMSEWIFRWMGNIDDPEDERWYGRHTDDADIPGWKDVLKEGQYEVVKDPDGSHAKIDLTNHTVYTRVRWLVTCRPLEGDDQYVTSDWSELAAIGKDAVKTELLKPGDVAVPKISDLRYNGDEFNSFPVIAFKLAVDETLEKQLAQVSGTQGGISLEVEGRVKGTEQWISLQGDWIVKAGEMTCALQNLAEHETKVEKDTPIELRARYCVSQPEQDDFYTDYSEPLVFGAEEMAVGTENTGTAEVSDAKTTAASANTEQKPEKKSLWWLWLLLLLLVVIAVCVYIFIIKKKNQKKEG
ncbi:MAG: hypothetical protein IK107_05680 [Oscillospiraceae bacterium]|nr:hypothetical protein [Oscillospiraceae bacterium]